MSDEATRAGSHDPERWQRIETAFLEALELPEPERVAFLDRTLGDDPSARAEVEAMLSVSDERSQPAPFERRIAEQDSAGDDDPRLGSVVGRYRLLSLIGQGGMGSVYRAERADGARTQPVAVKLLRATQLTGPARERFRVEREVLARLSHRDIVPLLDGGVTDDGLPFLVMPFIPGEPITTHCDRLRLGLRERLRLFQTTCHAVQHAHAHLIVHRDLKPSNILVTAEDDVRLLDFGIAKLLDPSALGLPEHETRTETRVMTPRYAAPEQLRGEETTTATDVHALGLLLYELLVGRHPYRLEGSGQLQVLQALATRSPRRPATALLETVRHQRDEDRDSTAEEIAHARGTTRNGLLSSLRGDLESIVLMALRPEPERRYAGADQLADDVGRYLDDLPALAHPDSFGYRLRSFVRRNRGFVVGVATAFVLLVLGTLGTGLGLLEARRQQGEAEQATLVAERAAQRAGTTRRFFLEVLASAKPSVEGRDTTVLQALELARERVESSFADEPLVRADVHAELGRTFHELGHGELAEQHLRQALTLHEAEQGPEAPETLASLVDLGAVLIPLGETPDAARLDEARDLLERAERLVRAGDPPDTERLGSLLATRAQLAWQRQDAEAAEALVRESLRHFSAAHATRPPGLLQLEANLASALNAQGRRTEASARLRELRLLAREQLGEDDPITLNATALLAAVLNDRGLYAEAESHHREALAGRLAVMGEHHPLTLTARNNLAFALRNDGRADESVQLLHQNLEIAREVAGPTHVFTLITLDNLARAYQAGGHLAEAETAHREGLKLCRQGQGGAAPLTLKKTEGVAEFLVTLGQLDEAAHLLDAGEPLVRTERPDDEALLARYEATRSRLLRARGRLEEADEHLDRALTRLPADDAPLPSTWNQAIERLQPALMAAGRMTQAEELASRNR
ncbi:MAG: serine/threonine-protein kinase [Acidobacteriota bacterium]